MVFLKKAAAVSGNVLHVVRCVVAERSALFSSKAGGPAFACAILKAVGNAQSGSRAGAARLCGDGAAAK
jgi:hypothetical protein